MQSSNNPQTSTHPIYSSSSGYSSSSPSYEFNSSSSHYIPSQDQLIWTRIYQKNQLKLIVSDSQNSYLIGNQLGFGTFGTVYAAEKINPSSVDLETSTPGTIRYSTTQPLNTQHYAFKYLHSHSKIILSASINEENEKNKLKVFSKKPTTTNLQYRTAIEKKLAKYIKREIAIAKQNKKQLDYLNLIYKHNYNNLQTEATYLNKYYGQHSSVRAEILISASCFIVSFDYENFKANIRFNSNLLLALRRAKGITLYQYINTQLNAHYTFERLLNLMLGITEEMTKLHDQDQIGILHLDASPNNIMVYTDTKAIAPEKIELIDFGVAKPIKNPDNTPMTTKLVYTNIICNHWLKKRLAPRDEAPANLESGPNITVGPEDDAYTMLFSFKTLLSIFIGANKHETIKLFANYLYHTFDYIMEQLNIIELKVPRIMEAITCIIQILKFLSTPIYQHSNTNTCNKMLSPNTQSIINSIKANLSILNEIWNDFFFAWANINIIQLAQEQVITLEQELSNSNKSSISSSSSPAAKRSTQENAPLAPLSPLDINKLNASLRTLNISSNFSSCLGKRPLEGSIISAKKRNKENLSIGTTSEASISEVRNTVATPSRVM